MPLFVGPTELDNFPILCLPYFQLIKRKALRNNISVKPYLFDASPV